MFRYRWQGNRQGETINWKNTGLNKRIHPTQKPVQLYEWLLKNYAKSGDTILDTHIGSGSIMLACHKWEFDLTGFEIDKEYHDGAVDRLKEYTAQQELYLKQRVC
jgi:site-specific DNA-methyltransferase (adenine-specific)